MGHLKGGKRYGSGEEVWEVVKGIFLQWGNCCIDRETGNMFVSAIGSAACFGSVPCREQGIERD